MVFSKVFGQRGMLKVKLLGVSVCAVVMPMRTLRLRGIGWFSMAKA